MTSNHIAQIMRKVKPDDQDVWQSHAAQVVVGKDILELLSSSMYLDPLTIYREYVQNSIDAIEVAKQAGLADASSAGQVKIDIDPQARRIKIQDDGVGISASVFEETLLSFGASRKRGTTARGFRGVGRLSGLGYCQELIFRSRAEGDPFVSELRWDCRSLKSSLRSTDDSAVLSEIVKRMVATRRVSGADTPKRFFEVELNGVIRHRNDNLLAPHVVADYLAQVAPVPFSPNFKFGDDIVRALTKHMTLGHIDLKISGIGAQIFRPFLDTFTIGDEKSDQFSDLQIAEIPGLDGGVAAVACILHHGYTGAIPNMARIKGLRARCGNIQVGENSIFEELFPETRFNAWSVGEVHIVDRRIVPNGRRDHFEQNVHYDNLLNYIAPIARDISRRCRSSSIMRKRDRFFEIKVKDVEEKLSVLKQRSLPKRKRAALGSDIERSILTLESEYADSLPLEPENARNVELGRLRVKFKKAIGSQPTKDPLAKLTPSKRRMYEHLFSLIYDCSTNRVAAKALIDRILLKIV
jgi:hypothetical protein